ncbi:uncharacterized protein LOC132066361 [Lycium ferocissimum]|uniref:uncharacterized protein LOC132066361 n=1 Tax=Lycium ferocissimum TaxID=112874 RepID=UPI0028150510|nr:uncharacterized protein LOC132066361 [Lycium ferocissimum]
MRDGGKRDWWRVAWNKMNIPKHNFIYWLAMHGRLQTKGRLVEMGICQDNLCCLCGSCPETIEYLYFDCIFSRTCLEMILQWLKIKVNNTEMAGMWKRMARWARGKISRGVIWAVLAALVYQIWNARNGTCWSQAVPSPLVVIKQIKGESKIRVFDILHRKQDVKIGNG